MSVGSQMRSLREARELSVKDLAFMVNIDPIILRDWEDDKHDPDFSTFIKVLYFLGVTRLSFNDRGGE